VTDGSRSPGQPTLPSPGEAGPPAPSAGSTVLVIEVGLLDEWDTLALARLPRRNLLRKAMRRGRARAR
jgi:hypothetical protein